MEYGGKGKEAHHVTVDTLQMLLDNLFMKGKKLREQKDFSNISPRDFLSTSKCISFDLT